MGKLWIVQGDTTSHGGTVLSGDPNFTISGKPAARIGDPVFCPKCKGTFPIVQGRPTVLSHGPNMAHEGMMTGCGATLIGGGQALGFWIDGGNGQASNAAAGTNSPAKQKPKYDEQVKLLDALGKSMKDTLYTIKKASGEIIHGTTDHQGNIDRVHTKTAEKFEVYVGHRTDL